MGRELKRVPLDFEYPLNKVWTGYVPSIEKIKSINGIYEKAPYVKDCKSISEICDKCNESIKNCNEGVHCIWCNEDIRKEWFKEVPEGDGYQLWENTSEGSPTSPVFKTLEELCEWCENNATTFAHFTASKEEWFEMLGNDRVHHKEGDVVFL